MSIKVSVIMASYNGEDYIEESVRSILVQIENSIKVDLHNSADLKYGMEQAS